MKKKVVTNKVLTKPEKYEEALKSYNERIPAGTNPADSKTHKKAFQMFEELVKEGHQDSKFRLGLCYFNGKGVAKDKKKAIEIWNELATNGYEPVISKLKQLGNFYSRQSEKYQAALKDFNEKVPDSKKSEDSLIHQEAFQAFKELAEEGHEASAFQLGLCYFEGKGVVKDTNKAIKIWEELAKKDYIPAILQLGYCYSEGEGVGKNEDEAIKLYSKVIIIDKGDDSIDHENLLWLLGKAKEGNKNAQYIIGYCYEHDILASASEKEKVSTFSSWYNTSREHGPTEVEQQAINALKKDLASFKKYKDEIKGQKAKIDTQKEDLWKTKVNCDRAQNTALVGCGIAALASGAEVYLILTDILTVAILATNPALLILAAIMVVLVASLVTLAVATHKTNTVQKHEAVLIERKQALDQKEAALAL